MALKKDTLVDLDMTANPTGQHLDAAAWDDLINKDDVVLIDTRNSYEVAYGTFKNAVNPDTETFAGITEWFEKNINMNDKSQKIAMFCTGGIRCEKFNGLSLVAQHKMVYDSIGMQMGRELHALKINTKPK